MYSIICTYITMCMLYICIYNIYVYIVTHIVYIYIFELTLYRLCPWSKWRDLLYLFRLICFKSVLSDIRIVTPYCFLASFAWNNFFLSSHSKVESVLKSDVHCFRQQKNGSCSLTQSAGLHISFGGLKSLILNVIFEKSVLVGVILLFFCCYISWCLIYLLV